MMGLSPLALAGPEVPRAVHASVSGAPDTHQWTLLIQGGFPWQSLRGQWGASAQVAVTAEVQSALGRRWVPAVGVSTTLLRTPTWRMSAEVLGGALLQGGVLRRRAAHLEGRFRVAVTGAVVPYLLLRSAHGVQAHRDIIRSAEGERRTLTWQHLWSPGFTLGLGVPLTPAIGLDVGVDINQIEGAFSIPGAHVGLHLGGAR